MSFIIKKHISTGVTWVAIEEADLYICCGCPADTVKHLKKAGMIHQVEIDGILCENGPNALLLSDTLVQNGQVSNLTEFPILQMLYLQGMNLPHSPNYKKIKPLLIGYDKQIKMQIDYVSIGNHGLNSVEDIISAGVKPENAEKIFATKIHFTGGKISEMEELVSSCVVNEQQVEIRNGVFIKRQGFNEFEISYKEDTVVVDLNIQDDEHFLAPYTLPFKHIMPGKFSITHTGEGNGWDANRPCMASVIHHNERTFIIDAGPNILNNLSFLGIGLSEIDGIFLSHIHDDHFAGITELLNVERKLNFYSTNLVRRTAEKKLNALMNSEINLIDVAFNCIDLEFDQWTNLNGLEVKPIYSPHTVETSTFNFRVLDNQEYKTYTHLSDTINLKEFKTIVHQAPQYFSDEDITFIENSYFSKVNLKKVDVGGGVIHGHVSDYESDDSDLIVLAHTSSPMEINRDNFINVDFGEIHTLIADYDQSCQRAKAFAFLKHYFNVLDDNAVGKLSREHTRTFKPGDLMLSKDDRHKIFLVINGIVTFKERSGRDKHLDAGNFIGFSRKYFRDMLPESYSAWSHVQCIEYSESLINELIANYSLSEYFTQRISLMRILSGSKIVDNLLSNSILNLLSKHSVEISSKHFGFSAEEMRENLFIITKGTVKIKTEDKHMFEIGIGEHFGGLKLMYDYRRNQQFFLEEQFEAVSIPADIIAKVPKLIWRLLELEEKRHQISIFTAK